MPLCQPIVFATVKLNWIKSTRFEAPQLHHETALWYVSNSIQNKCIVFFDQVEIPGIIHTSHKLKYQAGNSNNKLSCAVVVEVNHSIRKRRKASLHFEFLLSRSAPDKQFLCSQLFLSRKNLNNKELAMFLSFFLSCSEAAVAAAVTSLEKAAVSSQLIGWEKSPGKQLPTADERRSSGRSGVEWSCTVQLETEQQKQQQLLYWWCQSAGQEGNVGYYLSGDLLEILGGEED